MFKKHKCYRRNNSIEKHRVDIDHSIDSDDRKKNIYKGKTDIEKSIT